MLYPVMTSSRSVIDLSGIWKFKLDDGSGLSEGVYLQPLKDPMNMPVPSSYNDLKEDVSFRDHYGYVFYQRTKTYPRTSVLEVRLINQFSKYSAGFEQFM